MPSDVDDKGHVILAVYWTPFVIALLVFCARMVARIKFVPSVSVDDYTMVLAMLTVTLSSILNTVAVRHGLGQHIWTLRPEMAVHAVQYSWIAQAFSISTFAVGKISIALFLLLRVLGPARSRWHTAFLYFVIISLILVNGIVIVLVFTQCKPLQKLFDPNSPGHCWSQRITTTWAQVAGGWSAATDIGLVFFAVWVVGHLQTSWKIKVRPCCLLGLGVFAGGCAVAKTYYLSEHENEAVNDLTYGQTNLLIWIALEQYIIIIGANVPCVQPVVIAFASKIKTTYSRYRTTHYPLDEMSVRPSHSRQDSSSTSLGNRDGGYYEGNSFLHGHSANNDIQPSDFGEGILKTIDMDVRYGSGSKRISDASGMA